MVAYWLMKSELDVYPWSQLVEDEWTHWDDFVTINPEI